MEWLDDETRNKLQFNLKNILAEELSNKGWGRFKSEENSEFSEYLITDLRGINFASGLIRYTLKNAKARIIYRGQDRDYPLLPSLYRSCRNSYETELLENRLEEVLNIISGVFYPSGTAEERELVCQHYGMPTRFLDVADNIQTAMWFAYDRTMAAKVHEAQDDDVGFINILAVPDNPELVKVIDLRNQSPEFLRIHTQQAFAMKKASPGEGNGLFTSFIAAKFIIPRTLLRLWSNYDNIPFEYMFPPENMDEGFRHWEAANAKLRENNIDAGKYLRINAE